MRPGRLQFPLVLTLGVAFLVSLGINLRQSWRLALLERQQAEDLRSLRQLEAALRQRELPKPLPETEILTPPGDCRAAIAQRNATIELLNRALSEAQANNMGLQAQLVSAGEEREKALASAEESRQKEEADLQSQIDTLKQDVESAQAESQASRQRFAALEAEDAKLKTDSSASAARAAEVGRVVADLQDLDNRRDALLTSMMRRYRDVTSQFRAMSGVLGSSRDSNSSPLSDAALSRIQSAIATADDDLRQLTELNAQGRQLEKKLARK
jgi:CII-binding regulator of phage lambda lysogenization HflD